MYVLTLLRVSLIAVMLALTIMVCIIKQITGIIKCISIVCVDLGGTTVEHFGIQLLLWPEGHDFGKGETYRFDYSPAGLSSNVYTL